MAQPQVYRTESKDLCRRRVRADDATDVADVKATRCGAHGMQKHPYAGTSSIQQLLTSGPEVHHIWRPRVKELKGSFNGMYPWYSVSVRDVEPSLANCPGSGRDPLSSVWGPEQEPGSD